MEDTRKLTDVLAVVKYKIINKAPMMTAREEFVEQMIMDAVDIFGYDFIFGDNK